MAQFMAELYVPRGEGGAGALAAARARRAAEALGADGAAVTLLQVLLVPEDETCFLVVEADSLGTVEEAGRRARLELERVSEVVPSSSLVSHEIGQRST